VAALRRELPRSRAARLAGSEARQQATKKLARCSFRLLLDSRNHLQHVRLIIRSHPAMQQELLSSFFGRAAADRLA
jgi:hypothetical protein